MQNQKQQPEKSSTEKEKKFFLEVDEKLALEGRYSLIKQYQYLIRVINMDIQAFIPLVVMKRLSIPQDKNYILSQDNSYITLPGGEDEHPSKTE